MGQLFAGAIRDGFAPGGQHSGQVIGGEAGIVGEDAAELGEDERFEVVAGPALIEDVDTVIAVNPGWSYAVGLDLSGTLRRQA